MRRGFSKDIKVEAITKRYQGLQWKDIQDKIREKYGVSPSIRQMQKWFEDYHRGTAVDPTGVKSIATAIEEAAGRAASLAYAKMMAEMIPLCRELQEHHAISEEDAFWIALESFHEAQLGRQKYDEMHSLYLSLRDNLVLPPLTWSTYLARRDDFVVRRQAGALPSMKVRQGTEQK